MSISHLAAIGSLLSVLLMLAACQGIEVKPASRGGGSNWGAGSSGHN